MSIECRYSQCPRSSGAQCIYTANRINLLKLCDYDQDIYVCTPLISITTEGLIRNRWVSLEFLKFQAASNPEIQIQWLGLFINAVQPNLRATIFGALLYGIRSMPTTFRDTT